MTYTLPPTASLKSPSKDESVTVVALEKKTESAPPDLAELAANRVPVTTPVEKDWREPTKRGRRGGGGGGEGGGEG